LAGAYNGYTTFALKPITIDVATDTAGVTYDPGTTFVRFGLGALHITVTAMDFDVALGAYSSAAPTLDQVMGSVNLGAMNIFINPLSYVDIYSHTGQGVNFTMNVIIDRFDLGYVSWGDSDGVDLTYDTVGYFGSAASAGYVGLNGLVLGSATEAGITVTGNVAIDVVSTIDGIYAVLPTAVDALHTEIADGSIADPTDTAALIARLGVIYSWLITTGGYTTAGGTVIADNPSVTAVHISFPGSGMSLNIGSLRSQVAISNGPTLAAGVNTGIMGDIYLQNLDIDIAGGSWVDIWAH